MVLEVVIVLLCSILMVASSSCMMVIAASRNRPSSKDARGSSFSGCRGGMPGKSAADNDVLRSTERLVTELMTLLRKKAASGDRLASAISAWTIHASLFTEAGGRLQKHSNKHACLFINPNTKDNRRPQRLQSKVCHEVAHIVGRGHDQEWFDAWTYLLRLSSRELGWTNEIACGSCIKYNLCDKKMCPECTWLKGNHDTSCTPRGKRGTLRT
jgi:hypothetical protein